VVIIRKQILRRKVEIKGCFICVMNKVAGNLEFVDGLVGLWFVARKAVISQFLKGVEFK
jgi:hypothetical protein